MMHVEEFSKVAFGSSIFIIIVPPMTIVANGLLLVTFLVDPLWRKLPTTINIYNGVIND